MNHLWRGKIFTICGPVLGGRTLVGLTFMPSSSCLISGSPPPFRPPCWARRARCTPCPCPPMLFKLHPCNQKLCPCIQKLSNVYYPPTPSLGWIGQIKDRSLSLAIVHKPMPTHYNMAPMHPCPPMNKISHPCPPKTHGHGGVAGRGRPLPVPATWSFMAQVWLPTLSLTSLENT